MNLDEIFKLIFKATNYPEEKHKEFINTFFKYLFTKSLMIVKENDPDAAQKLVDAMQKKDVKSEEVKQVWEELLQNEKVKEQLDKVSDQIINELVDDITGSATEEQKQEILNSLPASN